MDSIDESENESGADEDGEVQEEDIFRTDSPKVKKNENKDEKLQIRLFSDLQKQMFEQAQNDDPFDDLLVTSAALKNEDNPVRNGNLISL